MNPMRSVWNWLGCGLAACCLLPTAALAAAADSLQIEAIDVEGGAATLYITPEHQSLLIDTGWSADMGAKDPDSVQRIIAAARRHGLSKLDYVLITHYHADHVGGVPELLSQFPVGTLLDHGPSREVPPPNLPPAAAQSQPAALYPKYLEAIYGHRHRTMKPGETLDIGSLHLTVVTSDAVTIDHALAGGGNTIAECADMRPMEKDGGEENARSLGVVMTFGQARIAAFGDLTWNMEQKLFCRPTRWGLSICSSCLTTARISATVPRCCMLCSPGSPSWTTARRRALMSRLTRRYRRRRA